MDPHLATLARNFAIASMTEEMRQGDIPKHVHGTIGGYNNYGCRGPLCRAAMAERGSAPRPPLWEADRIVWETVRETMLDVQEGPTYKKRRTS